jgi:PAS domain S-box-containing protein
VDEVEVGGRRVVYLSSKFALPREGGAPLVAGISIDVTERMRAEEEVRRLNAELEDRVMRRTSELRATNETLRALIRSAPAAIMAADGEGRVQMWNPAAEAIFGWTEAEVVGRPVPIARPGREHLFWEDFRARWRGERTGGREIPCRCKDGSELVVYLATALLHDASGEVTAVMGTMIDISDLKAAEQRLAASAKEWQDTFDAIQDAVLIVDVSHRVLRANRASRALFGVEPEGRECRELLGEVCDEPLMAEVDAGLREGQAQHFSVHLDGKGQEGERWLDLYAYPVREAAATSAIVLVIRDITEDVRVRQALQAQERLAAVGQLAAGIAHDFNNILNIILGYVELMQDEPGRSAADREHLGVIYQQGQRAADLVREILDFSRRGMARPVALEVRPFLEEQARYLRQTLPEDIVVRAEIDPTVPAVEGDPTQIQRIITNVAMNSRDAMPEGGEILLSAGVLELRAGERPPRPGMAPGRWVALSIADTGHGIPREHLERIFEPFFTTKDAGKGSGLGLSQVYGIVAQHGGFVHVQSVPERGTQLTVYLPASRERKPAPTAGPEAGVEAGPAAGKGEVILLVEDDASVRAVMERMLERLGYEVIAVGSGSEALRRYEAGRERIALVLTDIAMPDMDGLRLTRALVERDAGVKVLTISGYPRLREEGEGVPAGNLVGTLQKPVTMSELASALRGALGG